MSEPYPSLPIEAIAATRDALHAYAKVLGDLLKQCRAKRKHWWHASLRPTLRGLSTGRVQTDIEWELEIDLVNSALVMRTAAGVDHAVALNGQPANALAESVGAFLAEAGAGPKARPVPSTDEARTAPHPGYDPAAASEIGAAFRSVSAAMVALRAGIREETSPIQVWPHHFDLSMLWLPGTRVPDQDPANEEYADVQMNVGFTLGDASIPEPYLYVTAYPLPESLPATPLPAGTTWRSDGFAGAVLHYRDLVAQPDPRAYLLDVWGRLLSAGREHMLGDRANESTGG